VRLKSGRYFIGHFLQHNVFECPIHIVKSVKSTLWNLGMGKLSHFEIMKSGIHDLEVLDSHLETNGKLPNAEEKFRYLIESYTQSNNNHNVFKGKQGSYFAGTEPRELDCLVFAVVANIYWGEMSPLKAKLLGKLNNPYCNKRIQFASLLSKKQ